MLLVHRDLHGNLTAAIDYQVVNEHGQPNPHGYYIWVEQLEVNYSENTISHIQHFIEEIASLQPAALGAYWERRDKADRQPLWFSRERLITFARRDGDVALSGLTID